MAVIRWSAFNESVWPWVVTFVAAPSQLLFCGAFCLRIPLPAPATCVGVTVLAASLDHDIWALSLMPPFAKQLVHQSYDPITCFVIADDERGVSQRAGADCDYGPREFSLR